MDAATGDTHTSASSAPSNYLLESFLEARASYEESARQDPAAGTAADSETELVADLPAHW